MNKFSNNKSFKPLIKFFNKFSKMKFFNVLFLITFVLYLLFQNAQSHVKGDVIDEMVNSVHISYLFILHFI